MTLASVFLRRPFAHRGLHNVEDGQPENSLAAFRAAIAGGYGIELDLQLSADGAAMVFHDYALDRLTHEKGAVRLRKAAELGATRLKGGDEGIPTLMEVLSLVAGRAPMLIELKDQDGGMGDDLGPLEAAVAAALADYEGPAAVMSFNPNSVARLAQLAPQVPRGIVTDPYRYNEWPLPEATCDRLREIPDYDRVGATFISHDVNDLGRPRVAELKAAGASILCWTVRSALQEAEARRIVDNITFEGYAAALPA
ncbi:MAG: phosphodiesterase [Sulfitobacter sp.]|nr:phosphodiesterase [Sulfitobacter sp.]